MKVPFKLSLAACRVNANMSQKQAVDKFWQNSGIKMSRQLLARYENNPHEIPHMYAKEFSRIYGIPMDYINFK